ncbi:MAG: sensor histidine kinase [Campylobacterales bacterium]|nr:sensor histidine kinase [Campylobacterales bacterium]
MQTWLKQFHYKELFLIGFYLSFITITSIAAFIDLMIANDFDLWLDLLFVAVGVGFLWYFLQSRNHKIAARAIYWTASAIVFLFVYHNAFNMSIMFTLLLPVVAFILMPPREILINMSLYYAVLAALFVQGFYRYEGHPFLHDDRALASYFIASLFVLAFGIFYNYAIEESHRKLEKANREKEILLKEIHHRIKNNLNIISSILGLQKLETNHPDIDRIIDQNRLRIESISLAHETLYRSGNLEAVDFGTYVRQLAEQALVAAGKEKEVTLKFHSDDATFELEKTIRLGIIINELLTNSIKYACQNGTCSVAMALTCKDESCILHYSDSGDTHALPVCDDTLGLSLVKLTLEQLHGTLFMHDPKPYHYRMEFPA